MDSRTKTILMGITGTMILLAVILALTVG